MRTINARFTIVDIILILLAGVATSSLGARWAVPLALAATAAAIAVWRLLIVAGHILTTLQADQHQYADDHASQ